MNVLLEKIKTSKKNLFVGLAGPGTGKSHTFKIIADSKEFNGKKILILSFINKLVDELKDDFENYDNVEVSTLHSFASKKLGIKESEIIFEESLDFFISDDAFYINGSNISYEKKFQDNELDQNELNFYKTRQNFYSWSNNRIYSFNSVINAINQVFSSNESEIPEYDLVLIDEFQDFNKLEWSFIKHLNKESRMVLVGDDDQSLYSWKQARPEQIRLLYDNEDTEEFTLDNCYRCTEVIVKAVNDLLRKAKQDGYLKDSKPKIFKYPENPLDKQKESSKLYKRIDFVPKVNGEQLIYHLAKQIREDLSKSKPNKDEKDRILVIVPHFYKQKIYEGLIKTGFNVVEYSLFSEEKNGDVKHKELIGAFNVLLVRKTDNLALRKILYLYLNKEEIKKLIVTSNTKKNGLWNCFEKSTRDDIEKDIEIFKKVKKGELSLSNEELQRFSKIFNLKNILPKIINGFEHTKRNSPEVEITTAMTSKGLSADFVYYIGIDDRNFFHKNMNINEKICEFLVGITRTRKRLVVFSFYDNNPRILKFLGEDYINRIEIKR